MLWLLLAVGLTANAQSLELPDVIRKGMEFSPEVKRAESAWRAASASRQQRERGLFPTIDALASGRLIDNPDRASGTLTNSATGEIYDAALRLTQPLYAGGALINGIGEIKVTEEIQRQELFNVRQTAVETLVSSYYALAEVEKMVELTNEHGQVLKSYADIVSRYERIGRSRRMDRLQATVNLSLNEADSVDLERRRVAATDALRRLLGTQDPIPPIGDKSKIVIAAASPPALEQALKAVEENNPELQIAELERQRQEYRNALDFVTHKPKLRIEGAWGVRSDERPNWFESESRYYSVGLVLEIPLFSGLSSLAQRRVHTELNRQVDRSVDITRLSLRERLQAAITTLTSEFKRLTVAQTAAQQGREALQLATGAYRQGTASNQDVLNAQQTRYRSEQVLIGSQFNYLRALLNLRRLMGVDLEKVYAK